MGASRDESFKYPRTPHPFGSTGTADDKRLGERESQRFLADPSLIVEEEMDGTNAGLHFAADGHLVLQCRGHLVATGMHNQYVFFKQWRPSSPIESKRMNVGSDDARLGIGQRGLPLVLERNLPNNSLAFFMDGHGRRGLHTPDH